MYKIYEGTIARGFQFASGEAVNRKTNPSPFSAGTLTLQDRFFKQRGFDLSQAIPNLFWGTVNIKINDEISLHRSDLTLDHVDWTKDQKSSEAKINPETFSFVRCCLAYGDLYYPGFLYYPHPETKPSTNDHAYNVLEVITQFVEGASYGESAAIMCRADAFKPRPVL